VQRGIQRNLEEPSGYAEWLRVSKMYLCWDLYVCIHVLGCTLLSSLTSSLPNYMWPKFESILRGIKSSRLMSHIGQSE
jgi:hypothetical protein